MLSNSSHSTSADPAEAVALQANLSEQQQDMAQVIHVTQVYYAAVIAVVLWDWLLNFSREYRLIWRARWTAGKVAYLLMRYMSTAVAMIVITIGTYGSFGYSTCNQLVKVNAAIAVVIVMSCETVLGLRTWSMWNGNRWITGYLALHWVAILVVLVINIAIGVKPAPIPRATGACIATGDKLLSSFCVAALSYEVATTVLMTVRSIKVMGLTGVMTSKDLFGVLARDGIVYAIIVCSLNAINVGFILQNDHPLIKGINAAPKMYFTAVACCHLVLSLLERGQRMAGHTPQPFHANNVSTILRSEDPRQPGVVHSVPFIRRPSSSLVRSHHGCYCMQDGHDQSQTSLEEYKRRVSTPDFSGIHVNTEVEVYSERSEKSAV